jgi:hypothetical protein
MSNVAFMSLTPAPSNSLAMSFQFIANPVNMHAFLTSSHRQWRQTSAEHFEEHIVMY